MLKVQQDMLARMEILSENVILITNHLANQLPIVEDVKLNRLQVIKYLEISNTTYKRAVADGSLKPQKGPGGHFYWKSTNLDAYKESIRRGRI